MNAKKSEQSARPLLTVNNNEVYRVRHLWKECEATVENIGIFRFYVSRPNPVPAKRTCHLGHVKKEVDYV